MHILDIFERRLKYVAIKAYDLEPKVVAKVFTEFKKDLDTGAIKNYTLPNSAPLADFFTTSFINYVKVKLNLKQKPKKVTDDYGLTERNKKINITDIFERRLKYVVFKMYDVDRDTLDEIFLEYRKYLESGKAKSYKVGINSPTIIDFYTSQFTDFAKKRLGITKKANRVDD